MTELPGLFSGAAAVWGGSPFPPSGAGANETLPDRGTLTTFFRKRCVAMHKAAGSEPTKGQLMAEINAAVASKLRELGSRGWFPATPKKGSATPKKGSPSKAAAEGPTRCLGIRAGHAPVRTIDKRRLRSKRGLAPSGAGAEAPSGSAAKASSRTEAPGATPTDAAEEVEMKGGGDLVLSSLLPGAA